MTPDKDGKANHGHSCVKGRFAWGYTTHKDRILKPMIRAKFTDPWREVSWEEAIGHAASEFKRIQAKYGRDSIGGITSSRCSNEETFLVQKMVRAAFGNNNTDTCARVCHSPTGYGMKTTLGTSAGTQDFDSVEAADVIMIIGANPTDAHPVFASHMKRRLREGARLIIVDPRRIDLVKTPHVQADYHLPLLPGTNVAMINSLAHVVVTEGLVDEPYVKERCDLVAFEQWRKFVARGEKFSGGHGKIHGRSRGRCPCRGQALRHRRQRSDLLRPRRHRAQPGINHGHGHVQPGDGYRQHRQERRRRQSAARAEQRAGLLRHGLVPARVSRATGTSPRTAVRESFEKEWHVPLQSEPGLRIPNMIDAAVDGTFKGIYIQGEDIVQSDPNTQHISAGLAAMECVVVQDLFLNETASYAHVFLPGSSFLEKDGTFTNAERRISRVRKAIEPMAGLADWEATMALSNALGYPMHYNHPSEIMDEIARLTPTFAGVSYEKLDRLGSLQWPCNDKAPEGTPVMHIGGFVRGKGRFMITEFVPTDERVTARFPLILTTGRILSQYNVGAQTRRTPNNVWHDMDVLEIHPSDAEDRGIKEGDLVSLASREGDITLPARISERMQPGVVYTTFHHAMTGANVVTTEFSDWATNCPEYKVTAVQVQLARHMSEWQEQYLETRKQTTRIEKESTAND